MVERNWRIFKSWTTDAFKRFIEILGFVSQMMRNHHNPPKGCSWAGTFFLRDHMSSSKMDLLHHLKEDSAYTFTHAGLDSHMAFSYFT